MGSWPAFDDAMRSYPAVAGLSPAEMSEMELTLEGSGEKDHYYRPLRGLTINSANPRGKKQDIVPGHGQAAATIVTVAFY